VHGRMTLLPLHAQVLAFMREHEGRRILCAFNFSDRDATLDLPTGWSAASPLTGSGLGGARIEGTHLRFEPWGGLFLQA
jgi:alpha-glucosidase